mmetsp:Transcript_22879/g.66074  ORF Transcript_22879/g.66074 Transcript_22879/m.66074 type:complete len:235 (-) Transcript_22879:144-848(-)
MAAATIKSSITFQPVSSASRKSLRGPTTHNFTRSSSKKAPANTVSMMSQPRQSGSRSQLKPMHTAFRTTKAPMSVLHPMSRRTPSKRECFAGSGRGRSEFWSSDRIILMFCRLFMERPLRCFATCGKELLDRTSSPERISGEWLLASLMAEPFKDRPEASSTISLKDARRFLSSAPCPCLGCSFDCFSSENGDMACTSVPREPIGVMLENMLLRWGTDSCNLSMRDSKTAICSR